MNNFTFCYWLQGYFELSQSNEVPLKTVSLIREHLDLVIQKDGFFCSWLEGYFDMGGVKAWDEDITRKIKLKLGNEFLTIIDPSYPEDEQETLQAIHENYKESKLENFC